MKQAVTMLLAALAAAAAAAAWAQFRTIPPEALRGKLTHVAETIVTIDGRTMQLAPGAQIRSQTNTIVVPSQVPRGTLVEYTMNRDRQLDRVWMLSPTEAARPNRNSTQTWIDGQPAGTPIEQVIPPSKAPANPQHK